MFVRLGRKLRRAAPRLLSAVFVAAQILLLLPWQFSSPAPQVTAPSAAVPVAADKDRSAPFPCQDRPCGCRSAAQCWKKCCCFSHSQKVEWARRYKVRVPAFVKRAAEHESERQGTAAVCCKTKAVAPGQSPDRPSTCRPLNSGSLLKRAADTDVNPSKSTLPPAGTVLQVAAQECQGLSTHLVWVETAPAPACLNPTAEVERGTPLVISPATWQLVERQRPPVPPPRAS